MPNDLACNVSAWEECWNDGSTKVTGYVMYWTSKRPCPRSDEVRSVSHRGTLDSVQSQNAPTMNSLHGRRASRLEAMLLGLSTSASLGVLDRLPPCCYRGETTVGGYIYVYL